MKMDMSLLSDQPVNNDSGKMKNDNKVSKEGDDKKTEPSSSEGHKRSKEGKRRRSHSKERRRSHSKERSSKRDSDRDRRKSKSPSARRKSKSPVGRRKRSRSRGSEKRGGSPRRQKSRSGSREKHSDKRKDSRSTRNGSPQKREHSPVRHKRRSTSRDKDRGRAHRRHRTKSRSKSPVKEKRRSRDRKRSRTRSRSRSRSRTFRRRTPPRGARSKLASLGLSFDSTTSTAVVATSANSLAQPKLSGGNVTPQQALAQTMAIMSAQAQQMTGIAIPKCYNPAAVNPLKYAEQMKKRKLLWSGKKEEKEEAAAVAPAPLPQSSNQWEQTSFSHDPEGKMASKFKKLMGIKGEGSTVPLSTYSAASLDEDKIRRQEELFKTLDQQYEVARMSTHTHRGVGLGFGHNPAFPK